MAGQRDALCVGITAVAELFLGDITLNETLRRVADLAQDIIAGSDMASVTLKVPGHPRATVYTDDRAFEIDGAQFRAGIGPSLEAIRCQAVQRVDSTATDDRWPAFSEAARARGILSSLSIPLVIRHLGVGAVNCYSLVETAFTRDDERRGCEFAGPVAIALANAQAYWDARNVCERLELAMKSRATIEQAKGIVIASQRCRPDEAFAMLVSTSQRRNRKLRDIADEMVKSLSP
jgi:GAF domain-containing protein